MKSTITYTVEVTEFIDLLDDYDKEEEIQSVKEHIEDIFPTADVHVENFKVFEGTDEEHE